MDEKTDTAIISPTMDKTQLLDMWTFEWPVMDVLIGGMSSIDLPELRIETWDDATDFLRAYGYDPEDPRERRLIDATLVESLSFIESQLLQPHEWERGVRPPDDILLCDDTRHLLLRASGKSPNDRLGRAWACAILRVMHTVAHIEGINRTVDMDEARQQIFQRFKSYLSRDNEERLWLGDEQMRVELEDVQWKGNKSRQSIILKLLHKRDNVAEAIYDFVGIRLITKTFSDVMLVVKCLRHFNMVVFPNAYPSRVRNNLIDLPRFRAQIRALHDMLMAGSITADEFQTMVSRLSTPPPAADQVKTNPHSSTLYRSIQLTGRQLIKLDHYEYEWLSKIKRAVKSPDIHTQAAKVLGEMSALVDDWYSVRDNLHLGVFFPFEVQIMDHTSYLHAESGEANHNRYKMSQIRAARKRILTKVLELSQ
jgi:uncharacterized protein (TIGR04562 family)